MSLLEGHGDVTMDRAGAGAIPSAARFSRGPAPAPPPDAGPGQAAPAAHRPRGQAAPVRGGRAVHRRRRGVGRARPCSTGCGGGPTGCRRWTRSATRPWVGRVDQPRCRREPPPRSRDRPDDRPPGRCWPGARSRRRGRRSICGVSGGPDSLALLVLAVAAGCRVTAVHVDHGLRPGSADEAEVVAAAAARFGAAFRSERVPVRRRPEPRGPGPGGPPRRPRARRRHRPHHGRPGRDGAGQPAAGGRARRTGRHAPGPPPPAAGPAAGRDRRPSAAASGSTRCTTPRNDDPRYLRNRVRHELLPLLRRAGRPGPGPRPGPPGRGAGRRRRPARPPWPAWSTPPTPGPWPAAPSPLARRAVRRWLRGRRAVRPAGRRPVARVLEPPARPGSGGPAEVPGGRTGGHRLGRPPRGAGARRTAGRPERAGRPVQSARGHDGRR